MDIYVDGSNIDPNNMKNSRKGKNVNATPGAGYAIVTDDKIFIKKYNRSMNTHFMEFRALIGAIQMAKPGDVIHTDQKTLVDCIAEHGDPTFSTRPHTVRPYNHVLKTQILRALKKVSGISIVYASSKECKKQKAGHVTRLADYFSGYAAGGRSAHVMNYKGDREVVTL